MKDLLIEAEDHTTTHGLLAEPPDKKTTGSAVLLLPDPKGSRGNFRYHHQALSLARQGVYALTIALPNTEARTPNTRGEHIKYAAAAYDVLTSSSLGFNIDRVGIFGAGHSGYLAVLLTQVKPVARLALYDPALYSDEDLKNPAVKLSSEDPLAYRKHSLHPGLTFDIKTPGQPAPVPLSIECIQQFKGGLLMVELVRRNQPPKTAILDYMRYARSVTSWSHQTIDGDIQRYNHSCRLTRILTSWFVDKNSIDLP